MHRKTNKSENMGKDSIWRLLFVFAGPATISNLVGASYNVVNSIFIGKWGGTTTLAAITVSTPIIFIFMAIETGTAVGAASLISRRLGAGKHLDASIIACTTITLSLLIGGLTAAICLPAMDPLLRLFGADIDILPQARQYLSIMVIFGFVESFYFMIGAIIRAEGAPLFTSIVYMLSFLFNIILDPILIYGWGAAPELGISGAAIATVISRGIGGLLFLGYFISGRTSFQFKPAFFIPRFSILKEIYRVGFAAIARQGGFSVIMIFINRSAASFGNTTLAVAGIIFRTNSFARMPAFGIGQGMMPLIGYNFGAKKMQRVGEIVVKAGKLALAWGILCALLGLIFPAQILSIFNNKDEEFIRQGVIAMRIFSISYIVMGLQFNLSSFFQGIGRGMASMIVGLSREFLFILPLIYVFPVFLKEVGIWVTFAVSDVLAIILAIIWFVVESKRAGITYHLRYPKSKQSDVYEELSPVKTIEK